MLWGAKKGANCELLRLLHLQFQIPTAMGLTSLDISDVDPVWTWGDKRPPPTKKQKKLVILKKKIVFEIW